MKSNLQAPLLNAEEFHSFQRSQTTPQLYKDTKYVLSLEGGGVKGYSELALLNKLEQETGKPISSLFQGGIIGTSIGGIIAALLTVPDDYDPMQPKYSTTELLEIFQEFAKDIFQISVCKNLSRILRCKNAAKYDHVILEEKLEQYLGTHKMKDAVVPCSVITLENKNSEPYIISSHNEYQDWKMVDATRASSAAPTFLDPHTVDGKLFIDGGLVANNPSGPGLASLLNHTDLKEYKTELIYINIGEKNIFAEENTTLGFLLTMLGRGFDSREAISSQIAMNLIGKEQFHEIEIPFQQHMKMDNISNEAFDQQREYAEMAWSKYKDKLVTVLNIRPKQVETNQDNVMQPSSLVTDTQQIVKKPPSKQLSNIDEDKQIEDQIDDQIDDFTSLPQNIHDNNTTSTLNDIQTIYHDNLETIGNNAILENDDHYQSMN